ncbi:MAG: GNAT family N-acetyltransferase [Lachnospiraceae bacterium]|nr:GNAT family N-acetyltransferase [Lachnospiraceae bacterium]
MRITKIEKENIEGFSSVISQEIASAGDLAIGAILEEKAAGAAVFSAAGEALILDYLFVDPQFRGKGIGKQLVMDPVQKLEPEAVHVSFEEENEGLYGFFHKLGFAMLPGARIYSVTIKSLLGSDMAKRLLGMKSGEKSLRLEELRSGQRRMLEGKLRHAGLERLLTDEVLHSSLSLASIDGASGQPNACILCTRPEQEIFVELLFSEANDITTLSGLFLGFYEELKKEKLLGEELVFVSDTEGVVELVKRMARGTLKERGRMIDGFWEQTQK